jgi:hypothetical protein
VSISSVCRSVGLSVGVTVCVRTFGWLVDCVAGWLFVCLSVYLCVCLRVCVSVCLCVCLSAVCVSVCLSVCHTYTLRPLSTHTHIHTHIHTYLPPLPHQPCGEDGAGVGHLSVGRSVGLSVGVSVCVRTFGWLVGCVAARSYGEGRACSSDRPTSRRLALDSVCVIVPPSHTNFSSR